MNCDEFRTFFNAVKQHHSDADAAHDHVDRCESCRRYVVTIADLRLEEKLAAMPWPEPVVRPIDLELRAERDARREEMLSPTPNEE